MKLVLLPGMDGTGLLFKPLLPLLATPQEIIPFNSALNQTYEAIYTYVKAKLPNEDFYLVAESFSGSIAARLAFANIQNLKGIIFVATFLSCPSKPLVSLAKKLSLKRLLKIPLASYFIRKLLIGPKFPIELFYKSISEMTEFEFKARLSALESLSENAVNIKSTIPVLYLYAENDYLVSENHISEFVSLFGNVSVSHVQGTHFLLQSNPESCAKYINEFVMHKHTVLKR
jgi:pimeloyl-[acyl-carrier protein] methyl ester esterase